MGKAPPGSVAIAAPGPFIISLEIYRKNDFSPGTDEKGNPIVFTDSVNVEIK
jgi:hypothetical protein